MLQITRMDPVEESSTPERAGRRANPVHPVETPAEEPRAPTGAPLLRHPCLYPFVCCAALLICIAAAHPFANSAFNDDWSYSHVALRFAETGRLHYNGWGSPTILFQTLWGAAWIRIFGFSFDVLRAATIPFSVGFVLLVYALERKAGLRRDLALFGALTVATSPLFLPLASSFMTDVYGCFFLTLCLYAALSSAQAATGGGAIRWLWALVIAGAVGGANRQVVWAAPLVLIPYLLWRARSSRRFAVHAVAAYAFLIGFTALILAKFSQPYAPLQLSTGEIIAAVSHRWFAVPLLAADSALTALLVSLPALLCLVPLWKRMRSDELIGCCFVATASAAVLAGFLGAKRGLAPFIGNTLTPFGILEPGQDAPGFRPAILGLPVRVALTWLVSFGAAAFFRLWRMRRDRLVPAAGPIFLLFSGAYVALLLPGDLLGMTFDRYLLPLLPLLIIFTLRQFQGFERPLGVSAWVCLLLFTFYSVATTHDYFSSLRARAIAAEKVEQLGIVRTRISAGFEYDGWTQLQAAGTVGPLHYEEMINPNAAMDLGFWSRAYALNPKYVAGYSSLSGLPEKRLLTVPLHTWLPPFRRAVVVVKRADLRDLSAFSPSQ